MSVSYIDMATVDGHSHYFDTKRSVADKQTRQINGNFYTTAIRLSPLFIFTQIRASGTAAHY